MTDEHQHEQPAAGEEQNAPDQSTQPPVAPVRPMLTRKQFTVSKKIADRLKEERRGPRSQVMKIVATRGSDFAWRKMEEALRIEAAGGMMTKSGNRRRTLGGIFFHLVRLDLTEDERSAIFPPMQWSKKTERDPNAPPPPPPAPRLPEFEYESRAETVSTLESEGLLNTVKVVMVGRPLSLTHGDKVVVAEMVYQARAPFFPRGVPHSVEFDTQYPVYMATKQWDKVVAALDDPEDKLIIEGTCGWSQELDRVAVYATNVTTRALERARYQK
jgi:hypothetical protein